MKHWNKKQIQEFTKQAISLWGKSFWMLGYEMQVAIIHAQALSVCRMQARDVAVAAMDELVRAMEEEAGLSQD